MFDTLEQIQSKMSEYYFLEQVTQNKTEGGGIGHVQDDFDVFLFKNLHDVILKKYLD